MVPLKILERTPLMVAAAVILAGCATTPAPVANHSFGPGQPVATASTTSPPAQHGAQTFGLGGHANGTVSAAGYTVAPGDTLYSIAFAHGMDVRQLAALNGLSSPYVIHPGQVLKLSAAASTGAPTPPARTVATTGAVPASASTQAGRPPPSHPAAPVFGPVTAQAITGTGVAPASPASTAVVAAAKPKLGTAAPAATMVPPVPTEPPPRPVGAPAATPPPSATRTVAGITWQWPATGKVLDGFQPGAGGDGAGLNIAGKMGDPVRAAAAGTVVYSGNGLIGYGELIIVKHNDTYLSAYGHNSKRLVKEGEHVAAGQEIALMGASGASRVELHFEIRKDGKPVDPLGYLPAR